MKSTVMISIGATANTMGSAFLINELKGRILADFGDRVEAVLVEDDELRIALTGFEEPDAINETPTTDAPSSYEKAVINEMIAADNEKEAAVMAERNKASAAKLAEAVAAYADAATKADAKDAEDDCDCPACQLRRKLGKIAGRAGVRVFRLNLNG